MACRLRLEGDSVYVLLLTSFMYGVGLVRNGSSLTKVYRHVLKSGVTISEVRREIGLDAIEDYQQAKKATCAAKEKNKGFRIDANENRRRFSRQAF